MSSRGDRFNPGPQAFDPNDENLSEDSWSEEDSTLDDDFAFVEKEAPSNNERGKTFPAYDCFLDTDYVEETYLLPCVPCNSALCSRPSECRNGE